MHKALRTLPTLAVMVVACLLAEVALAESSPKAKPVAIAIHGGAGTIRADALDPERRQAIVQTLTRAVQSGHHVLHKNGDAIHAVIAAIRILEASPLFNAGVGAVYTWDSTHELDASLMRGDTREAGAVAGVKHVASPIALARDVMTQSPHVLLSGAGADAFARLHGHNEVPNNYFDTPQRLQFLQRYKARLEGAYRPPAHPEKWGTVGAVALDRSGTIAAGTSTGGMTGKRWGRIGDSPLIGAGTWADNRSCAVSATGHGEFFIRYNVAADICARVRYRGLSIADASHQVLFDELLPAGGTGGVIAIDPQGNIAMPFNTEGMYRASIDTSGRLRVAIHATDEF